MKYSDINRRYTEIVAEYIGKGYTINSASMSGSQGETSKVDLTNGSEIIRVMVDTFSDWETGIEGVEIIVGRALNPDVLPHSNSGWATIWNNRLEILNQERFCKIGEDRRHGIHYGTEEEAAAASAKKLSRYIARTSSRQTENITDKAMEIAKRIIRKRFGYERIREADVTVSKYKNTYIVGYRNKTYRLR